MLRSREQEPDNPNENDNTNKRVSLFRDQQFLFIPSLLFSENIARLLVSRVEQHGGEAVICAMGEKGLKEATNISAAAGSSLQIFVCADISLIYKYAHKYDLQYRPPKWLRECMRDLRIKDPSIYMKKAVFPSRNKTLETPKTSRKRRRVSATPSDKVGSPPTKRVCAEITTQRKKPREFKFKNEIPKSVKRHGEKENNLSPKQDLNLTLIEKNKSRPSMKWACEIRTSFSGTDFPMNDKICELLGVVQQVCQARKEHFRAVGYQRAIAKISALKHEVTTLDDVRELTTNRGIGDKLEAKIMEIITTGRLRQAEAVLENKDNIAVKELCQVWGIGPVKALNLISHNINSVEKLRVAIQQNGNLLDKNQKIGLKHYEDLLIRIPRKQVAELETFVRMVAKTIDIGLEVKVAGSYLRGKKDCGDVDIMVRGTDAQLKNGFRKLVEALKKKGVLTDDLILGGNKYFGIFRFPGRPHGRIDLFAVPEQEYPFALLTYTGSAIFNR